MPSRREISTGKRWIVRTPACSVHVQIPQPRPEDTHALFSACNRRANAETGFVTEVGLLRQCVRWLHQLERGEDVIVVNMRPDTDRETEYVRFDRPRVMRILERIVPDLDQLAHGSVTLDADLATEHRRRLAATPEPMRRLGRNETL
jgi:hypothetical protein